VPPHQPHPLWPVLAGALIALAVSLATDVSLRFLSGGPDILGLLGTFTQAMLALLAGSAFTRVGGEKVEHVLDRLQVPRFRHPAWKTMLSAALLVVVVGFWSALPAVAKLYNDHGVRVLERGEVAAARAAFDRAIRLSPNYPAAHYNLAVAHEQLLDHELAIGEYQRAIRLDERLYAAYNNLARLLLLRRGDGAGALALIERGLALKPEDPDVRYSMLKNLGWAHLQLGHLLQAREELEEAIALRPRGGAAAHCLLAQVLDKAKQPSTEAWAQCSALAPDGRETVEPAWLSLAQERLKGAPP
jgi:Tfp pilus assembly protein PilF